MAAPTDLLGPAELEAPVGRREAIAGRSLGQLAWARLRRDKVAMTALVVLTLIVLVAAFAPVVTGAVGVDPLSQHPELLSPEGSLPLGRGGGISLSHPFGVEPLTGRDNFARLLYGSRISLLIAFSATAFTCAIGTVVGIIAGYSRGIWDTLLGRLMDLVLAFPLLLLLLSMSSVLTQRLEDLGVPPGNPARITYLILTISVFGWPYLARLVRGQVLSVREREFVEAAVAEGASTRRILFREILPNLWAPILVYATISLPNFIALEASLSFLGVGILPPEATWGAMLGDSVRYFTVDPAYLFIPGTLLFVVVFAFNLLGDAVRDALDPRAGRV
jgi:ABC-type dipeptide/oligopeptide/nickel transport system permease subunit